MSDANKAVIDDAVIVSALRTGIRRRNPADRRMPMLMRRSILQRRCGRSGRSREVRRRRVNGVPRLHAIARNVHRSRRANAASPSMRSAPLLQ